MKTRNTVRIGAVSDASYVEKLQRKFSDELGFIPRAATRERLKRHHVVIALENGDPAGFLLGAPAVSNARMIRPIYQAAVQMDAQRRHHGLKLLELLSAAASADSQTMLQCWCRESLEANDFWRVAGFIDVGRRDVNAVRESPCILWRKPLVIMTAAELSFMPTNPRNHAAGGRSVSRFAWTKLPHIELNAAAEISLELERMNKAA